MDLLREEADPVDLLRRNEVDSWDRKNGSNFKITIVKARVRCLDFGNLFVEVQRGWVVFFG